MILPRPARQQPASYIHQHILPSLHPNRREAGGVEALLGLLRSARQQQPATRELPRDEEAAEAAEVALHALLVLLTGGLRCCCCC